MHRAFMANIRIYLCWLVICFELLFSNMPQYLETGFVVTELSGVNIPHRLIQLTYNVMSEGILCWFSKMVKSSCVHTYRQCGGVRIQCLQHAISLQLELWDLWSGLVHDNFLLIHNMPCDNCCIMHSLGIVSSFSDNG